MEIGIGFYIDDRVVNNMPKVSGDDRWSIRRKLSKKTGRDLPALTKMRDTSEMFAKFSLAPLICRCLAFGFGSILHDGRELEVMGHVNSGNAV